MRVLVVVTLLITLAECQEYVPGTPGASWTMEELITVKSKLYAIYADGGHDVIRELFGDSGLYMWPADTDAWRMYPNAAKMLRLGFHDCLKYTDGTGGCDGCLNWEGMGTRFDIDNEMEDSYDNVHESDNNGLELVVYVLEELYTNPNFPTNMAPSLEVSLKASGKSRADLWAFATLTAVEFGMETNNMVCDGTYNGNPRATQCNALVGMPECYAQSSSGALHFKTGRADCTEFGDEPYKATKPEVHPNVVGNGKMTADFFQEQFGFTGRETVAIMGAHTMGEFSGTFSLFRYKWTSREESQFNNNYYKNIVRETKYSWYDNQCTRVTDAEGNMPQARWVTLAWRMSKNGGPVQWVHDNYMCEQRCYSDQHADNECCEGYGQCKADSVSLEDDPNTIGGCEKWEHIIGLDECALPSEMGLYFNFDVDEDGVPSGCPGFEIFKPEMWNTTFWNRWSQIQDPATGQWIRSDPLCGPNTLEYPPGSTPLHQIFEEYAANQQQWIDEFVPALDKMLNNGYQDLTLSPYGSQTLFCNRVERRGIYSNYRYTNCRPNELQTQHLQTFRIISLLDGRAIQSNPGAKPTMNVVVADNINQLWYFSNYGNQIINVGTNLPLETSEGLMEGQTWQWLPGVRVLQEKRLFRVLRRSDDEVDGATISLSWNWNTPKFHWTLEPFDIPA